ncbi:MULTISPECIES: flagellar hook-length control protein FliK [unclassified Neptuniibacter]|uniref:flagellar hook-length control protein FliK n=1 Tax=unclassified Neptuniibacter TaxID=2630693 RepID=UPI0025D9AE73|nr:MULTISPECIES: flagellar hook-length control protein FliK [unclassified Neptuniibacter]|tara:strand:- start:18277 stop:20055 length:1779 start_codon:yes stop_codon:yes gene_type:complete
MSEQLSMPAGGGLLTLNLSVLPQGAGPAGSGGGLFGNFSSMLSQQGESVPESGLLKAGAFLPQSGTALPPSDSEELSSQALMQQQMLYVAQMLEQRVEGSEQLPSEISAELIQALRQYAERKPVLPEEESLTSGSVNPSDSEEAQSSGVVGDIDELFTAGVVGAPILLPTNENGRFLRDDEGRWLRSEDTNELSGLQKLVELASNLQQSGSTHSESADQIKKVVVDALGASVDRAVQVDDAVQGLVDKGAPVAPVAIESRAAAAEQQRVVEQVISRVADSAASTQKASVVASTDPVTTANAVVTSGERDKGVAQASVPAPVISQSDSESMDLEEPVKRVTPVVDTFQSKALDKNAQLADLAAKGSITNPAMKSDGLLKPMFDAAPSEKFGNALELTQQLMQKVSSNEKVVDTGFNQRMEALTSVAQTQTTAQPTQTQKTVSDAQNLMMPQHVQVNTPAWKNALGERAIMISAQNMRVAEIKLDPPELGSLSIRVNVNQDQVSLSFTSPHAHVRDAVEQSLPRLREMFAEQGLALQDSEVADQSADQQRREQLAEQGEGGSSTNQYMGDGSENSEETAATEGAESISLVDYYA